MANTSKLMCGTGAAGIALMALAGSALADGYGGSVKDAPADEGRKFTYAITVGAQSDYVFRGVSQTFEDPAIQGALDLTYWILYAGIWASHIDFGASQGLGPKVWGEYDLYAGVKRVWGPVTFDLGVIYYWYPNSDDFFNFIHPCCH
ncbi:MAG TPA: TorF family putative porin, partial [Hyphomicrobiaceae bacterium]|nr:TorF family putative porin [Hyphomicrobiaceae bacterium]